MNLIISALIGALTAGAVTLGGVNVAQTDEQPVAQKNLYTYSSQ
jgi:hypothetical protein